MRTGAFSAKWDLVCKGMRLESLLMPQSQDVNPNVVFQWAWGGMEKSRMSKHDTRKVLRNKHSGLIELLGLYSSLWLYDGKYERQSQNFNDWRDRLLSFVKAAKNNVSSPKITRQTTHMMHLACHYLETFSSIETAPSRSFGLCSELFNFVL